MENIEKEYYESGALLHEYSVRDGRKHGPYRRYYESGALRMSATYRDGFMEGPEEEFFENGQLQVRRVYCHGEVADSVVVALNPDGTLSETSEHTGKWAWKAAVAAATMAIAGSPANSGC